jgi:hypothetical protein
VKLSVKLFVGPVLWVNAVLLSRLFKATEGDPFSLLVANVGRASAE